MSGSSVIANYLRSQQAHIRALESRTGSLVELTNETGGALVHGDIVVVDAVNDESVELWAGTIPRIPLAVGQVFTINITFDGGGVELTTGVKKDLKVDLNCAIQGATLLADQIGSIVIDIWKDTYGAYPPTNADSITSLTPPTIVAAIKSDDVVLAGWITVIIAGETLRLNIDSVATITRVTLALKAVRT